MHRYFVVANCCAFLLYFGHSLRRFLAIQTEVGKSPSSLLKCAKYFATHDQEVPNN